MKQITQLQARCAFPFIKGWVRIRERVGVKGRFRIKGRVRVEGSVRVTIRGEVMIQTRGFRMRVT